MWGLKGRLPGGGDLWSGNLEDSEGFFRQRTKGLGLSFSGWYCLKVLSEEQANVLLSKEGTRAEQSTCSGPRGVAEQGRAWERKTDTWFYCSGPHYHTDILGAW